MRSQTGDKRFGIAEWVISLALAATWGSSFALIAVAIESLDAAVVPFARAITGGLALALFPGARLSIPKEHWPRIAVLGLVWMALPFLLFPLAEKTVASGIAGMINGGLPVVMACVTALWIRRVPSFSRISAIAVGLLGIGTITYPALQVDTTHDSTSADLKGILLLLIAVICYAIGANLARPLQAQYSPARLFMRVQLAAAVWSLPLAVPGLARSSFSWTSIGAVTVLGVFGTGIAFVAFGTLLERTGLTRAMIPTYFTPVVGVVLGSAFRSEQISLVSVVGMCIVILSAWMTSKPDASDAKLSDIGSRRS